MKTSLLLGSVLGLTACAGMASKNDRASNTAEAPAEAAQVLLAIDAEGRVLYGGRDVGVGGVGALLEAIQSPGGLKVTIQSAGDAPAAVLVQVIDAARASGAQSVEVTGAAPAVANSAEELMVQEGAGAPPDGIQEAGFSMPQEARGGPQQEETKAPWLSESDLAFMRSAEFKRRFMESYLSETDIEPTYTQEDLEVLQEVQALLNWTSDRELAEGKEPTPEQEARDEQQRKEKRQEAIEVLEEANGPKASAVFDFFLGNLALQDGDFEVAKNHYLDATGKMPKFRRCWGNLGQVHFQLEEYPQAIVAFSRVVALGGGDGVTYGLLGICAMRIDDPIAAESGFRMAAMLQPEKKDWKLGIVESFFKQQRFAEAVALFDLLLAREPENTQLWLGQGEAYARMGKILKAAENFEMLDRLGGSTVESLYNLGDIYSNEGLYGPAVSAYVRAMEKDPSRKPERVLRAATYMVGNEALVEADELLAEINRLHSGNLDEATQKDLLRTKARLAVARGDEDAEASILKDVVALDPLDGDALILLGQYYGRQGELEQAALYFQRAAQIEEFAADANVRHAQMLVRANKFREAVPLLKAAQQLKPREAIGGFLDQVERRARTQK